MKRFFKNGLALLLVLSITLSLFIPAFAQEQVLVYSTSYNSGERDTICVTLAGTSAAEYYTGEYTYDNLSELSSSQLLYSLRELMTDTHKKQTSYENCRDYADQTDCENENGKIITLYTSVETSLSNYNSGNTWNREHVWPKSIGGFETSGGGSDLHHIRPAESNVNSTRSNRKYGNVIDGKTVSGKINGSIGGTYGSSSAGSDYFEPEDHVKGDVARICLYVYVRWGGTYSQSSNITNVFQSVDILLDWCELDPVDTWEMGRNEVVGAIQGNRNVFIDYPELAWELFGREVPDDMITPSGEANGNTSGGTTTPTTPPTTHTWNAGVITVAPTCTQTGIKTYTCSDCGETYTETLEATGHTFNNKVCIDCGFVTTEVPTKSATITFDDAKTQRTSFSTSQQIWKSGDVTFTNNKASSSNNVADYTNPIRLYKSSTITIDAPSTITKIEILSDSSSTYKTALKNTLTNAGISYSNSGNTYTIFDLGTDSVTISLAAQVRFMSITVTYGKDECAHPNLTLVSETSATCTAKGEKIYTCDDCNETVTEALPAKGHSYSGSVTTAPTHLTEGVKTFTCLCGDTYTEAVSKLTDHTYDIYEQYDFDQHKVTCECGDFFYEDHTLVNDACTSCDWFKDPKSDPNHSFMGEEHSFCTHEWISGGIVDFTITYTCSLCKNQKVVELPYLAGDANADGKIDLNDAVLVKVYLANLDYATGTSSMGVAPGADANDDGKIDLNDAVLLALYLANYDYDLGSSSVILGKQNT